MLNTKAITVLKASLNLRHKVFFGAVWTLRGLRRLRSERIETTSWRSSSRLSADLRLRPSAGPRSGGPWPPSWPGTRRLESGAASMHWQPPTLVVTGLWASQPHWWPASWAPGHCSLSPVRPHVKASLSLSDHWQSPVSSLVSRPATRCRPAHSLAQLAGSCSLSPSPVHCSVTSVPLHMETFLPLRRGCTWSLQFTVHLQHHVTSRGDNRHSLETKQNLNPVDRCNCSLNAGTWQNCSAQANFAQPSQVGWTWEIELSSRILGLYWQTEKENGRTQQNTKLTGHRYYQNPKRPEPAVVISFDQSPNAVAFT